jgi:hypothetical protein
VSSSQSDIDIEQVRSVKRAYPWVHPDG